MKRTGFTLIELLVVIAIIAILAAILFPVFATAREKARQSACISNAKQIGLAIMQYTGDYDERYPGGTAYYQCSTGWAGEVYPYVKSAAVYRCPDDQNPSSGNWTSFGINMNLATRNGTTDTNNGAVMSQLGAPAVTVLLFELTGNSATDVTSPTENNSPSGFGLGAFTPYGYDPDSNNSASTCTATTPLLKYATGDLGSRGDNCFFSATTGRHNNGAIYVLADGHAKWMIGNLISSGYAETYSSTAAQGMGTGYSATAAGTQGTINGQPIIATFNLL